LKAPRPAEPAVPLLPVTGVERDGEAGVKGEVI
jgi:hypothetical protein